jgi:DNA polymerase
MASTSRRTFSEWRAAARPLLAAGVRAEDVEWESDWSPAPATKCFSSESGPATSTDSAAIATLTESAALGPLAGAAAPPARAAAAPGVAAEPALAMPATVPAPPAPVVEVRLSRSLIDLLECISHYRHAGRWELMYRLAYRASRENPRLLDDEADRDVRHARSMERAVERECHKMHAFVRFRELKRDDGVLTWFAWFEPEHEILPRAAPFFANRFANATWTIATPDGAALWEHGALRFIDAPLENQAPRHDAHEALWRTYYRSICNVARINPRAMQREMPQRYWRNLPETAEIPALVRDGLEIFTQRHSEVDDSHLQTPLSIQRALADLPSFESGPAACRRCDLWRHATQAVLGEGPSNASLFLVGEQPGDEEDLRGQPFVGPAGKLLNDVLREAGLNRTDLYITNAVKHFKWEPRGKRRLHKRPHTSEVTACSGWLEQEVASVQPRVIVALGATALRAVAGSTDSVEAARDLALRHSRGAQIVCTYHPSAILRAEPDRAQLLRERLIHDLCRAAELSAGAE